MHSRWRQSGARDDGNVLIVPGCDIVLLCLPAFLVEETVIKLAPFVDPARLAADKVPILGSIVANTGFFIFCHKHLSPQTKLFSFQRVPYVARVSEYAKSAKLLGFRDELLPRGDRGEDFLLLDVSQRVTPMNVLLIDGLQWYEIDGEADLAFAEEYVSI